MMMRIIIYIRCSQYDDHSRLPCTMQSSWWSSSFIYSYNAHSGFLFFFWISGIISGTKRATGDPLMSKRPNFQVLFIYMRGPQGLSARRAWGTKSSRTKESKAVPKGPQLEVGARRAPRLLYIILHLKKRIHFTMCIVGSGDLDPCNLFALELPHHICLMPTFQHLQCNSVAHLKLQTFLFFAPKCLPSKRKMWLVSICA